MARYQKGYFLEDLTVRILVGSACLVEIAIKSGNIWNFSFLEDLLKTEGYVGKFRKMADGIVSTDPTFENIETQIAEYIGTETGGSNIIYWKYNPLWEVVFNKSTRNRFFGYFIENICDIPELHPFLPNRMFYLTEEIRNQEQEYIDNDFLNFDDFITFENFFLITAFARKAIDNDQWHLKYRYGLATRKLFPHIVCATPQIFIKWQLLAKIYSDTFWSAPQGYNGMDWTMTNWGSLEKEMEWHERNARKSGINLPPPHVMQRLNTKFPKRKNCH